MPKIESSRFARSNHKPWLFWDINILGKKTTHGHEENDVKRKTHSFKSTNE